MLKELERAFCSVTSPAYLPLEFLGDQLRPRPPRLAKVMGASMKWSLGMMPSSSAAAYTMGLKLEPGWR